MEYDIDSHSIYAANKYPNGLRRKWSEKQVSCECHYCGSENTDADLSGDLLMLCCLECDNWWTGAIGQVVTMSKRGEVRINLPKHFDANGVY